MIDSNCDVQVERLESEPLTLVRILTVPKNEDVRSKVVGECDEDLTDSNEDDATLWGKDILFFPREWSPDQDVHDNVYDEDDEDAIEVRPAGAIAQWIRNNAEFKFFCVAANEIRVIVNQRQAALIRDQFGRYPPTPSCATGDAAPDKS